MAEMEDTAAYSRQWHMALSTWENEGGAGPAGARRGTVSTEVQSTLLKLTNAELVQLGSAHTVMLHYVHALRGFRQSAARVDQVEADEAGHRCGTMFRDSDQPAISV